MTYTDRAAAIMVTTKLSQQWDLAQILRPGETVVWSGKPEFAPFVLRALGALVFGLIWLIVPVTIITVLHTHRVVGDTFGKLGLQLFMVPFFAIGVALVLAPAYNAVVHRFVEYVITDRRVIVVGGLGSRNVKVVELASVISSSVTVGLIDRLYGTGTVRFFSGEREGSGDGAASAYDSFYALRDPYGVLKRMQDTVDTLRNRR